MSTTQIIERGATVTYLGYYATVVLGNEPDPEWTGSDEPGNTVNIRFTGTFPRGWSKQQDVFVTSCIVVEESK